MRRLRLISTTTGLYPSAAGLFVAAGLYVIRDPRCLAQHLMTAYGIWHPGRTDR